LPRNLHIEELNAAADLAAFRARHGDQLHEIARRGTFLDDRDIDRFLSLSLPGLDELMAVLELGRRLSAGRYRTILVDTAPSGTVPLPVQVEAPGPYPGPDQRLLIFCGKSGVGKTTLTCATALHIAATEPHRRTLLFSGDLAHSLGDCLGVPVGPKPVAVSQRLTAIEVDAQAEFAAMRSAYGEELRVFSPGSRPTWISPSTSGL